MKRVLESSIKVLNELLLFFFNFKMHQNCIYGCPSNCFSIKAFSSSLFRKFQNRNKDSR